MIEIMMSPRTIRIVAIVLILIVCLAGLAGWDIVFDRFVTSEWPPHYELF